MRAVVSSVLHRELAKLIDLPPNLVSAEIKLSVNEIVSVTCTYRPELKIGFAEPVTQRFGLHPINESEPGPGTAQPPQRP
jgi:hypothetical protein